MSTLSPSQIYALARGAGLSPAAATTATAVALAESGGKTDVLGDVALEDGTWGPSVGLWQIRSLRAQTGTGGPRDATRLTDPQFNAASMASISGAGKSFGAWTTYTGGAYKNYLQQGAGAALGAGDNPNSTSGNALGEAASGFLNTIGLGSAVNAAPGIGQGVSAFASGWGGDAMKIGLYVIGGAAAAGLVIVGAVHTVSK